jgi:hypothetical protein
MKLTSTQTNPFKRLINLNKYCFIDKLLTTALRTIGLILIYYCFSIGITFFQKWFIKVFII